MDGAGLSELGGSVAAADGDEVGELVEDLAAGGAADPLRKQAPFALVERGEAGADLAFDQPVEEEGDADDRDEGGDAAVVVEEDGADGGQALAQAMLLDGRYCLITNDRQLAFCSSCAAVLV